MVLKARLVWAVNIEEARPPEEIMARPNRLLDDDAIAGESMAASRRW